MKDHSDLGGMFDMTGVVRGEDGIKRYEGLPRNLVQMFRAAVDRDGAAEAVVETGGGPRLSYASLWDRATRRYAVLSVPLELVTSLWPLRLTVVRVASQ